MTDKFNKKNYILEKKTLQFALALNKSSLPTFELLPEHLEEFSYLLREHPSFSEPPPISPIVPVQLPYFYQGCGRWIFSAGGATLCLTRQAWSLIQPQRLNIQSPFRRMLNRLFFGGSAKLFWLYYYYCYWTVTFLPKETAVSAAPWVFAL